MPIHHALLSLLADGESYGYELKGAFERSVGPQWGALNIGQLYQVLERLKRDGLVEIVRADPQPRRPDRLIYTFTDASRSELAAARRASSARPWLPRRALPDGRRRRPAGPERFVPVVRAQRQALLGELHALRALAAGGDALARLLAEGAALLVDARLQLLDLAEESAPALVAAAGADRPTGAGAGERLDESA